MTDSCLTHISNRISNRKTLAIASMLHNQGFVVVYMNETCRTYDCGMSHVGMSLVAPVNESDDKEIISTRVMSYTHEERHQQ